MSSGKTPKVKQRIIFITEGKVISIEFLFFILLIRLVGNLHAQETLCFFPIIVIRTIQFLDIQFRKGNSFLEVKHGIISTNCVNFLKVGNKNFHDFIPWLNAGFFSFKHGDIQRALFSIVSSIENGRNGEGFSYKVLFLFKNFTLAVCDNPAHIINQRTSNRNTLFLFTVTIGNLFSKRKSSRFTIEHHVPQFFRHNNSFLVWSVVPSLSV